MSETPKVKTILVIERDPDVQEILASAIKEYDADIEVLIVPDPDRANWIINELKTPLNLIFIDSELKGEIQLSNYANQKIYLSALDDPKSKQINKTANEQALTQRIAATLIDLDI